MPKFNILDDCNFGTSYLLYPESTFDKICLVEFQFKFCFCGKNFNSIQDAMKIWHAFVV